MLQTVLPKAPEMFCGRQNVVGDFPSARVWENNDWFFFNFLGELLFLMSWRSYQRLQRQEENMITEIETGT